MLNFEITLRAAKSCPDSQAQVALFVVWVVRVRVCVYVYVCVFVFLLFFSKCAENLVCSWNLLTYACNACTT